VCGNKVTKKVTKKIVPFVEKLIKPEEVDKPVVVLRPRHICVGILKAKGAYGKIGKHLSLEQLNEKVDGFNIPY
jgi:hypothetical protein